MENFTPVSSLIGGAMIGAAAVLLMLLNGRIAGISGIVDGLMSRQREEIAWRGAFIAGLIAAPLLYGLASGGLPVEFPGPTPLIIAGGFLVGLGTRIGGGCTSGHGVCGIARMSPRSIVATLSFMATGVLAVTVIRHLLGL